jgi:hypothetical protein
LTTTELSDLHEKARLFVDPNLTDEVWLDNPKPRPGAVTDTDPVDGTRAGLTLLMSGNAKVRVFEKDPTENELKTETEAATRFERPLEILALRMESELHVEL